MQNYIVWKVKSGYSNREKPLRSTQWIMEALAQFRTGEPTNIMFLGSNAAILGAVASNVVSCTLPSLVTNTGLLSLLREVINERHNSGRRDGDKVAPTDLGHTKVSGSGAKQTIS